MGLRPPLPPISDPFYPFNMVLRGPSRLWTSDHGVRWSDVRLLVPWLKVTLCEVSTPAAWPRPACPRTPELPACPRTPELPAPLSSSWGEYLAVATAAPYLCTQIHRWSPTESHGTKQWSLTSSATGFLSHNSKLYYLKTFLTGAGLTHTEWIPFIWTLLCTKNPTKNRSWRHGSDTHWSLRKKTHTAKRWDTKVTKWTRENAQWREDPHESNHLDGPRKVCVCVGAGGGGAEKALRCLYRCIFIPSHISGSQMCL